MNSANLAERRKEQRIEGQNRDTRRPSIGKEFLFGVGSGHVSQSADATEEFPKCSARHTGRTAPTYGCALDWVATPRSAYDTVPCRWCMSMHWAFTTPIHNSESLRQFWWQASGGCVVLWLRRSALQPAAKFPKVWWG